MASDSNNARLPITLKEVCSLQMKLGSTTRDACIVGILWNQLSAARGTVKAAVVAMPAAKRRRLLLELQESLKPKPEIPDEPA